MQKELDVARKIEKLRMVMEYEQTEMMFDVAVQTMEEGLTERLLGLQQPEISRTIFNEDNSLLQLEHQHSIHDLPEQSAF